MCSKVISRKMKKCQSLISIENQCNSFYLLSRLLYRFKWEIDIDEFVFSQNTMSLDVK